MIHDRPAPRSARTGARRFGAFLLLASAVLAGACRSTGAGETGVLPLSGTTVEGATLTVEPSPESTLLVFWASWCKSCRAEAPRIQALHARSGARLRVVGVNVDREVEAAREFQRSAGFGFASLRDPELELADRLDVSGTPTLLLLGPDGAVIARGHHPDEDDLSEALAPLLAPGGGGRTARVHHTSDLPTVRRSAVCMGTTIEFLVLTEERARAETAIDVALGEVTRIEELMTDWTDTSQVAAIGRAAGDHPVPVDRELLDLLVAAREVSELTGGKFDVTWAGAGRLWDFRADPPRLPDAGDVAAAVELVDYRDLVLDEEAGTAFLRRPGMRVGLGAIAKGYAVDRAVGVLERAGFSDFAVNAGGDLAVRGRRGEDLWWVSIRDPRDAGGFVGVLPVSNLSVVTSGDYERYFELDGVRYCHVLDPDTGWPARGARSVTVLASRTWWADALATGVFVLGPERGLELIETLDGVEGLIVAADGRLLTSRGLAPPLPPS